MTASIPNLASFEISSNSVMTYREFMDSIHDEDLPEGLNTLCQSLWYDFKGDWKKAHDLVDSLPGRDAAWVHAYLHRKEGDIWNADYWYRQAKKARPNLSLQDEWIALTKALFDIET